MNTKISLNEQIEKILAEEAVLAEHMSWKGKLKRIYQADNKKQAVKTEWLVLWQGLSKKAVFTLFLIFTFVFALTFSLL